MHMAKLLSLRKKLIDLEGLLPVLSRDRLDNERLDYLRLDFHLQLMYWHVRLYLGRPFILGGPYKSSVEPSSSQAPKVLLSQDSLEAARRIIEIGQLLRHRIGLAIKSYATEFLSCRAAMLVLIAHSLTQNDAVSDSSLDQGLELVKLMSKGGDQASADSKVIVALQQAIARLRRQNDVSIIGAHDASSNQQQFPLNEQWETLWHSGLASASHDSSSSLHGLMHGSDRRQQDYNLQQAMSEGVIQWSDKALGEGITTMPYSSGAFAGGASSLEEEQEGLVGIDFWDWDGPCDFPFELNEFNLFPDLFTQQPEQGGLAWTGN